MLSHRLLCTPLLALLMFAVISPSRGTAQKPKDKKPSGEGTPVIWRDPGNIAEKDLYWGSGSEDHAPKPPFAFKSEDLKGTQSKIDITDANGEKWKVKFGKEVHAETAATRLVWAFGYMVDETYYVPSGTIEGATGLSARAVSSALTGHFKRRASRDGQRTSNAPRSTGLGARTRSRAQRSCPG